MTTRGIASYIRDSGFLTIAVWVVFTVSPACATETVTLQLKWLHQFQFAGYYAAKALGYYRDAGLEVNIIEAIPGKSPIDAVVEGKAEYGVDVTRLLLARAEGKPVVALGVIFQHSPYILVTRQDSPTQNIHDLAGKRLMLEEKADDVSAYLKKEGLSNDRFTLVKHNFNPQDLIDGTVDAISAYSTNELFFLDQAGFRYQAYTPRSSGIDFYGDTLFTTEQELKNHPARVKAFREATLRGWKYALAHPEEIADLIIAKYSQRKSREHLLYEARQMAALMQPDLIELGYMNPGRWRHIADTYADLGMLPRNFSLGGFIYDPDPKYDHTLIMNLFMTLGACLVGVTIFVVLLRRQVRRKTQAIVVAAEQYQTILQSAPDGFWCVGRDGRLIDVNDRYVGLSGYSREELIGMPVDQLEQIDTEDDVQNRIKTLVESGFVRFESQHKRKDGTVWDVEVSSSYLPSKNEMIVFLRNITESKQAEKLIKVSEERLRAIMDNTDSVIYMKDVDSRYITINRRFEELFKVSRIEVLGKTDYDIFPAEIAAVFQESDHTVFNLGKPLSLEEIAPHDDGNHTYASVKFSLLGADGRAFAVCGISNDITEIKRAEQKLRDNEEQLKAIFETSSDAIGVSCKGTHVFANPSYLKMFGLNNLSELREISVLDLIGPSEHEKIKSYIKMRAESKPVPSHYETLGLRKDGSEFPMEVNVSGYVKAGEPYTVVIIRDISEQRRAEDEKKALEQQFQQAQKLESLGVLAGGIAHDFNNILAIIMGNCSLAAMDDENAGKYIPEIEKASERAAALCRQMLAYAGKAQLAKTHVNLSMLVGEMVTMLKSALPQNAVIKPDLSTDLPVIEADASQLRQVIMNLIINASEAIGKEHGEIQVSLANTTVMAGQSDMDYNCKAIPPGGYILLEVTDNGCGMDEETKWRIFEPFYTTKFTGRGLGMSAVLGIIKSHCGALQLHSQRGQGTTFKVYLPVPKDDSFIDKNTSATAPPAPWQGSGTILLVEDEDQVRLIAKAMLNNFGFTVLETVNGREALDIYQKNAAEITLVLTDMGMPVMDGYELFSELKKLNPELPIIVSSGYGDAEVSARIGSDNIAGIISKPYNPGQLRDVLKRVVEG